MRVLGIDPGIHTGLALVEIQGPNMFLLGADLDDPRKLGWLQPDYVVIEKPVIYPHTKTNPNDLITLAIQVGEYQQFFGKHLVTLVEARTWKGQVPKTVTENRVCAKFPNARTLLDRHPPSLRHNVSDAMGLAWWHACRCMRFTRNTP